jgi:hypothetical protein
LGLVACAVFKTVGRRLRRLWWVRFPSAPATHSAGSELREAGSVLPAWASRFPLLVSRTVTGAAVLLVLGLVHAPRAVAQLPVPGPPRAQRDTSGRDTIPVPQFRYPPPTPPLLAMARSLVLPGWGQAVLHRRVTGAVFVFWEGVSLTMALKASDQLSYLRRTDGDTLSVRLKKQEVQDWVVVLIFNHLMAGAEAFVSAELWDFPVTLQARALPENRLGVGAALYWGK